MIVKEDFPCEKIFTDFNKKYPNCTILHVAETGSRGRGLATNSSDYDVGIWFLPKLKRLYSVNRGTKSRHYNFNDKVNVQINDMEKNVSLIIKQNFTPMEQYYSDKIYFINDLDLAGVEELYNLAYDYQKLVNHYSFLGIKGGKRHKGKSFRRILWCYMATEYSTEEEPFRFNYTEILKDIVDKPKNNLEEIARESLLGSYFNKYEFKEFADYFESKINKNYKVRKNHNEIKEFGNNVLNKLIIKNIKNEL